ncbi:MAG: pirin family protein [Prolixibacteraceae bacterium]
MEQKSILQIKPLGFQWETLDPFIFCVHHRDEFPKGNPEMGPDASLSGRNIGQDFTVKDGWRMYHGQAIPGFPVHPHRGFETVTVVKEGLVDHTDSLGAAGRFGKGDVQWMTAGKGVQHSEMFPLVNQDKENPMELFQIWLNLPKAGKFVEPYFKMLWDEMIPLVKETDSNGKSTEINVIAGAYAKINAPDPTPDSWAANPDHELAIWTIQMDANAKWSLPKANPETNRVLYFYGGDQLILEGEKIPAYHSVQVNPDAEIEIQAGDESCYLLLLQGKPMNEPVVQYGPFVMNTEAEIRQAFQDYQKTQFGGWPWPKHEQVHPRNKGRFALYADGTEELKS